MGEYVFDHVAAELLRWRLRQDAHGWSLDMPSAERVTSTSQPTEWPVVTAAGCHGDDVSLTSLLWAVSARPVPEVDGVRGY